jgi:hypothetical protein
MQVPIVRVFVSSTWEDLQPEREALEKAIHRLSETSSPAWTTLAALAFVQMQPCADGDAPGFDQLPGGELPPCSQSV